VIICGVEQSDIPYLQPRLTAIQQVLLEKLSCVGKSALNYLHIFDI